MVSNQTEFNEKYNDKEVTEIQLKNKDFEEKQLVIEDYPNLETLYLRGIDSLDTLIFRNLGKLQKFTISDCGVQELVIENCSQIKELKVDDNSLTSMEFLKNLPNLQKLNIDDNPELASGLEFLPQSLKKFSCENTKLDYQEEDFKKKYETIKEVITSITKETQKELVGKLDQEIKEKEKASEQPKTQELVLGLKNSIKGMKEVKTELETSLAESEVKIQKLEQELVEAKSRAEERQKKIEELGQEHSLEEIDQTLVNEKTITFLRTKSIFLNARQETVGELKKCFIALEKKFSKHEIIGEVSSMVSGVGGVFDTVAFGIPGTVGEIIKSGNNFARINLIDRGNKEFQISLADEKELVQLHKDYNLLISLIYNNEESKDEPDINVLNLKDRTRDGKARAFNTDYEIFGILETKAV
jgi:hypothetical protein